MTKEEMDKSLIVKAELLAGDDNKTLSVTLSDGTKVIGKSLGIEFVEDDEGVDIPVLAFECPILGHIFWFSDDEIVTVELT